MAVRKIVSMKAEEIGNGLYISYPVPETCRHEILQYDLEWEILITTRMG